MGHVWEKSYPQGVSWDAPLPPAIPLESLLETAAGKWPERTAIDFYDRTFTFRELRDLAARSAKGLQAFGVGPGVHVGLHLPNTPHFVICFFAVLMAGGRVVNFSPLAAPRELKYQIEDAETRVMITLELPMLYPQIAALKGTGKFETLVVCSIADFLRLRLRRRSGQRRSGSAEPAARSISPCSSPTTARSDATRTARSRMRSRCCNTPEARPVSQRGPCSRTLISAQCSASTLIGTDLARTKSRKRSLRCCRCSIFSV